MYTSWYLLYTHTDAHTSRQTSSAAAAHSTLEPKPRAPINPNQPCERFLPLGGRPPSLGFPFPPHLLLLIPHGSRQQDYDGVCCIVHMPSTGLLQVSLALNHTCEFNTGTRGSSNSRRVNSILTAASVSLLATAAAAAAACVVCCCCLLQLH